MTSAPPPPVVTPSKPSKYAIESGPKPGAERILVYGSSGVGKSTLASLAPNPVFLDLGGNSRHIDVSRVVGINTYAEYLGFLRSDVPLQYRSVVLDDFATVLELAASHILETIPKEKGGKAKTLNDYGYSYGNVYLYDHVNLVLGACNALRDKGVNIIINLHQSPVEVPNPAGVDYQQFQPAILGKDDKSRTNIRGVVIGWSDYVFYVAFDRDVNDDGKARVSGSRTIYTQERGGFYAKSRTRIKASMPYEDGKCDIWNQIGLK